MSVRSVVKKPLAFFKADNIRRAFDEDELRKLGESLKRCQYHPVVVRSDGGLVDGERRVRAAKLVGLESLDAIIIDEPMTRTEVRVAQLVTAMHRLNPTAWETYQTCYELAQINPDKKDKELAELLSIKPENLSKIMAASKTIPDVRKAMEEGRIGASTVYAISKVPEAEQLALLESALLGATRDDLERQRRERKKPAVNGHKVEVRRFKATLPSGHTASFAGPMHYVSDLRDAARELARLADKAVRDGIGDIKAFETWLRAKDKGESQAS